MVSKTTVPPESEACVVEGLAVIYGVVHPAHIFSTLYITLLKQWDSIPIQVSLSLDHYATTDVHG